MKQHSDDFHADLTDEEADCWNREMDGVSIWSIFRDSRAKHKEEKAKAKAAIREAKSQGMRPEEHEYWKGVLKDLHDSGMTGEVAEDEGEGDDQGQDRSVDDH